MYTIDNDEIMGMKRKIDKMNRIVIPADYMKQVGIHKGDELEIFLTKKGIFIKI